MDTARHTDYTIVAKPTHRFFFWSEKKLYQNNYFSNFLINFENWGFDNNEYMNNGRGCTANAQSH